MNDTFRFYGGTFYIPCTYCGSICERNIHITKATCFQCAEKRRRQCSKLHPSKYIKKIKDTRSRISIQSTDDRFTPRQIKHLEGVQVGKRIIFPLVYTPL